MDLLHNLFSYFASNKSITASEQSITESEYTIITEPEQSIIEPEHSIITEPEQSITEPEHSIITEPEQSITEPEHSIIIEPEQSITEPELSIITVNQNLDILPDHEPQNLDSISDNEISQIHSLLTVDQIPRHLNPFNKSFKERIDLNWFMAKFGHAQQVYSMYSPPPQLKKLQISGGNRLIFVCKTSVQRLCWNKACKFHVQYNFYKKKKQWSFDDKRDKYHSISHTSSCIYFNSSGRQVLEMANLYIHIGSSVSVS